MVSWTMEGISDFINAPWISVVKVLKFVSSFDQIEPMLDFVKSNLQIRDSEAILFVNIHSPKSNQTVWPKKSEVSVKKLNSLKWFQQADFWWWIYVHCQALSVPIICCLLDLTWLPVLGCLCFSWSHYVAQIRTCSLIMQTWAWSTVYIP